MPDLAINYELLRKLGADAELLKEEIDDTRHRRLPFDVYATSPRAAMAIEYYYSKWDDAFGNAGRLLDKLGKTFTGVAEQWFNQDAQYAAQAAQQYALLRHGAWASDKQQYETWKEKSQTYVTVQRWDENGNPYFTTEPLADPDKGPEDPGDPPTHLTLEPKGEPGANVLRKIDTQVRYGEDGRFTSIETTVEGPNGLTYTEKTTFEENGLTTVSKQPDGTTVTSMQRENPDGTGTRTVTTTDSDGKTTTETYHGTGLTTDKPTWTKVRDDNAKPGGGSGGGPHHVPDTPGIHTKY
jgi:hypothetical protein